MQITLGRKLFFYTSGLLLFVLLIAFAVLERGQARQWQEYLQVQQIAFARFATPELLKHFRGNFSQATGPAHREQLEGLLGFNQDLLKFSLHSPSGRVLFDPPPLSQSDPIPSSQPSLVWARDALDPVARSIALDDGRRLLEIVAPAFGPTGAKVLSVRYLFSFSSVDQRLAEMRRAFLTIALVAAIIAIVLVFLVAKRFTLPIQRLTEGVRAISRGELQTHIVSKGTDELANLALAFNEMATNLDSSQAQLQDKNQQLQQANQQLQQIQERLIRTERLAAVGQVAAGVSHEIDNPVGIILGYAELLLEDCDPDEPRAEDLRGIIAECRRCKKITGGLLGLVRNGAQRLEPVQLTDLVAETIDSLQPQKLFRQIRIHFDRGILLPQVTGDADRLRQVLVNLLLNSAQALQGTGSLWIELETTEEQVRIAVHDNGPGIPEDAFEQIFEPFYSTKGRNQGTGLGLSVCRKLIEEHGGEISAGNSSHGGALLHISLPISTPIT